MKGRPLCTHARQPKRREHTVYQVLAHPLCEEAALALVRLNPVRFVYHPSTFAKFESGLDNIELGVC